MVKCSLFLMMLGLTLLFPLLSAELEITEVMYDPECSDADCEWLELYNSGSTALSLNGLFISDQKSDLMVEYNRTVILTTGSILAAQHRLIIAKSIINLTQYWNVTGLLAEAAKLSLNNGPEIITIYPYNLKLYYNSSWGGKGNGNPICLFNGSWQECQPTPGRANLPVSEEEEEPEEEPPEGEPDEPLSELILEVYLESPIYLNQKYDNLFKIKIEKANCSRKDNVTVLYTISKNNQIFVNATFNREIGCSGYSSTGEFTPSEIGNYTICGQVVSSTLNKVTVPICAEIAVVSPYSTICNVTLDLVLEEVKIYAQGESVKFKPQLNEEQFPYVIEYWIEDLFGQVVKNKLNTTNINQKSWQVKTAEQDRIFLIKALVYPLCNDLNLTDNLAQKLFLAVNEQYDAPGTSANNSTDPKDSTLKLDDDYFDSDPKLSWGEQAKIKVRIYKGDQTKYSVKLWAEQDGKKVSQITSVNLYDKYTDYELSLPLQLLPNCNSKLDDGKIDIFLSGLDLEDQEELTVKGLTSALCSESDSSASANSADSSTVEIKSQTVAEYSISSLPEQIYSNQVLPVTVQFQSDDQEHDYTVWSYLYRGSRCYSCTDDTLAREENTQSVHLSPAQTKTVSFNLQPDAELAAGEYKIKVKIQKDQQKIIKELTRTVQIMAPPATKQETSSSASATYTKAQELEQETTTSATIQTSTEREVRGGLVVYQSNTERTKQLIPYFLLITFVLMLIILFKDKRTA